MPHSMHMLLALIVTLVSNTCPLVCPATSLPPAAAAAAAFTVDAVKLRNWWPRIEFVLCS